MIFRRKKKISRKYPRNSLPIISIGRGEFRNNEIKDSENREWAISSEFVVDYSVEDLDEEQRMK